MPCVLNIKNPADCPANKVPDSALYIGTANAHYALPESKWRSRALSPMAVRPASMAALLELRGRDQPDGHVSSGTNLNG